MKNVYCLPWLTADEKGQGDHIKQKILNSGMHQSVPDFIVKNT